MQYGSKSRPISVTGYETEVGYLEYDDASNIISIPVRMRERHLTQETDTVSLQAIGLELQLAIWSERDNIAIRIPLSDWFCSNRYKQSLNGPKRGYISVGRFEDYLSAEDGKLLARVRTHELDEL